MNIFVFGSNEAGRHGKGAALFARLNHGAIYGQGEGIQGLAYGIPTKDSWLRTLPLGKISHYVDRFIKFASSHPEMTFNVTEIGCGLAGYTPNDIAPLFRGAPTNVVLSTNFQQILNSTNSIFEILNKEEH